MKLPRISAKTIVSSEFTWCAAEKSLVAEASTGDIAARAFSRMFAGHSDKGFNLQSAKTGQSALFELVHTQCDGEGDIQFWVFAPVMAATAQYPALRGVTVKIFND